VRVELTVPDAGDRFLLVVGDAARMNAAGIGSSGAELWDRWTLLIAPRLPAVAREVEVDLARPGPRPGPQR